MQLSLFYSVLLLNTWLDVSLTINKTMLTWHTFANNKNISHDLSSCKLHKIIPAVLFTDAKFAAQSLFINSDDFP